MNQITRKQKIINRVDVAEKLQSVLGDDLYDSSKRLGLVQVLKTELLAGKSEVQFRFENNSGNNIRGKDAMRGNSFLIDQLIRIIFDLATQRAYPTPNRTTSEQLSVVAIGGYGREELAPYSDVDLMFLIPYKETPYCEQVVEFILYMLWDMGLKVGHSTRSVDDVIRLARQDITIRTAVLDSRWLWGSQELYAELKYRFGSEVVEGTGASFVEAKLKERDERHDRMGDARYVVEPNLKEGKGGLRDLQTLYWLVRYLYNVTGIDELVSLNVFTKMDIKRYRKAHDFLSTVRCHIHYISKRAEERISFDVQKAIGEKMSYTDRAGISGVERFMKHYFLIAKDVGDLTRVLCAVLEEQQKKRSFFSLPNGFSVLRRKSKVEGFINDRGRIMIEHEGAFEKEPLKLIKVFHEAQENDLDIHPEALRLISRNLKLIDKNLRNNEDANRIFMNILISKKNPENALRRMNEADVLGKFLPDFGRVVAQMQFDMYHTYTVDEHTIRAIGMLSDAENGSTIYQMPCFSESLSKIQSRKSIYLAVFLHDIAKGRKGEHSTIGSEIAKKVCPRLGLNEEETETVSWLVLNHLLMSDIAFKRDIDNPETIKNFVSVVQSAERLRLLLILTVVDIKAVGPKTWNSWKAGLLSGLFKRTLEAISGDFVIDNREERIEHAKIMLKERLSHWRPSDLESFISTGYPSYWLPYGADEHVRHANISRLAKVERDNLFVDVRVDEQFEFTQITVYTPDHPGIFYQIAGAVALSGASIMDAKIITMSDGMVMDSFSILDANNRAFNQQNQIDRLRKRISDSLAGKINLERELMKVSQSSVKKKERLFYVAPRIIFDNDASKTHTVIEVNGRDRVGFLYDVTATINRLGLKIDSAHITTYGEHVVDTFYVKDIFGLKMVHESKLNEIREKLIETIKLQ